MAKKTEWERQFEELNALRAKGTVTEEEYRVRLAAINAASARAFAKGEHRIPFFRVGCFGLIALAVIVVIVAAVGASGGGSNSTNQAASAGTTPQVGTNPGDVHVRLKEGSVGSIAAEGNGDKKSQVTILRIVDNVTSTNQFEQPPAGKKWWGVEVQVQNVGTAEVTPLFWKLRDSKDLEHEQAFVLGAGQPLDFGFLTPGGKLQGWVYFEVDSNASPKWLRADPNPLLKNDLYFDAQ